MIIFIIIEGYFMFVLKVGGLGDVLTGLSKALQRRGHLVEIILPKYDCMQYEHVCDLRVGSLFRSRSSYLDSCSFSTFVSNTVSYPIQVLDVVLESYFDGRLFKNKVWVGTVEG